MSMEISLVSMQQSAGISVAKKAMASQEAMAYGLLRMAEASVPRQVAADGIGKIVYVRA